MSNFVTKAGVIDAAVAYTQQVVRAPYLGSLFGSLLIRPDIFKFEEFGGETAYRAVTGANAVTYDPAKGWTNNMNTGKVNWIKVKDTMDRAFCFNTDYMVEVNAILAGMTLSGIEVMNSSWLKYGQEVDMITFSRLYAATKSHKKNTDPGFGVDKDNIFNTLLNIETEQLKKGIPAAEKRITAISTTVYNALRQYLVEHGSLYNGNIMTPTQIKLNPVPKSVDPSNALGVNVNVYEFNNHLLTVIPDELMKTHVTILDGVTGGQEAGGVKADNASKGSANLDIISVPMSAAAVSVRHIVSMITVPLKALSIGSSTTLSLDESMKKFAGISQIENIGIDQSADQFGYKNRVRFDAIALEGFKDAIITVTDEPHS